jgi:phosphate:Na+ symporter
VNQFALLVTTIIKDKGVETEERHYKLAYTSATFQSTPELNIYRIDNEIREMARIVSSMYGRVSGVLDTLIDNPEKEKAVEELTAELQEKEVYADEMRDELTHFLMECNRQQISPRSERRISRLLRIITDLENMTDDCFKASLLLERSVKKDQVFTGESMKALVFYTGLVGEFLNFVQARLGRTLTREESKQAALAEKQINKERNKLRKYGRKRIEAGENVKTELLFIDFIRLLEQLGDYCYHISDALAHLED